MANENEQESHTIPVAEAVRLTTNWRNWMADPDGEFEKKAFLIPIEVINDLLSVNTGIAGVRAYLTLDDTENITTANLLIVPVKNGRDVLVHPNGDSNVYNTIKPCPPECDDGSDLGN